MGKSFVSHGKEKDALHASFASTCPCSESEGDSPCFPGVASGTGFTLIGPGSAPSDRNGGWSYPNEPISPCIVPKNRSAVRLSRLKLNVPCIVRCGRNFAVWSWKAWNDLGTDLRHRIGESFVSRWFPFL